MVQKTSPVSIDCADNRLADMLKAIGHPVRLSVVRKLAHSGACCCGEMCNCFPLSQSTVSQHLSVLRDAGVLNVKRIGTKSEYSLNVSAMSGLMDELGNLLSEAGCCCRDE